MRKFTKEESRKIADAVSAGRQRSLGRNQMEYLRGVLMNGNSSGVIYGFYSYSARIRQTLIASGILVELEGSNDYVVKPELLPDQLLD